jgi:predicted SprT family Zn-dependent metalloprotease
MTYQQFSDVWVLRPPSYKRSLERARSKRQAAGRGTPGSCEACGDVVPARHWDHDHTTGRFRGYLCRRCNSALAFAKDSPERLHALVAYLQRQR